MTASCSGIDTSNLLGLDFSYYFSLRHILNSKGLYYNFRLQLKLKVIYFGGVFMATYPVMLPADVWLLAVNNGSDQLLVVRWCVRGGRAQSVLIHLPGRTPAASLSLQYMPGRMYYVPLDSLVDPSVRTPVIYAHVWFT